MKDVPHDQRARAMTIFHAYASHVRGYYWHVALMVVGIFGMQVGDLVAPLYLKKFFNILAQNSPSSDVTALLTAALAAVASFWVVRWAGNRLEHFTNVYLESKVMASLYNRTFEYLLRHSYDFFTSRFAGSLTHKISKFSKAFEVMFDSIMLQFFPTTLFVCGAVGVLFFRSHALGLMLGVWAVCFVTFQIFVAKLRQPIRVARALADTRVTGALADAIGNHAAITLFSGVAYEGRLLGVIVDTWRRATIRSWLTDALIWSALGIFIIGIQVGLLWGAVVMWGKGLLTLGDFVLIQAYLLTTFDRLTSINMELRRFFDAYADAAEMVAILEEPHDVADVPGARPLAVSDGTIECKNVDFFFRETHPVLRHFDLAITSGEKIAIVGPSGAGKSTITKLMLRMFDITAGEILIDGQNIARVTQESLRDAMSYVPQEPILFHRSLMENIRYGKRDATDEEVIEAAKKAHCHEFIIDLPDQYDTFVGERGVKLSGGERQRVAIARAILKNAPILLLDEATSSLDSESEALIQDALDTIMRGKTTVVIAHRLSTIMKMDRIVVIENGAIAAEGTHGELLTAGGLYQKLWSIQAGGFIDPALSEEGESAEIENDEDDENDEKGSLKDAKAK